MKLSKNSWHYKLNMLYDDDVSYNLCPYFWKTMYRAILLPLNLVLAIPIFIITWIYRDRYDEGDPMWMKGLLGFTIYLGITAVICMALMFFIQNEITIAFGSGGWIILFITFGRWVHEKYEDRKQTSIFNSYFKAKKEKVCPKIEWED